MYMHSNNMDNTSITVSAVDQCYDVGSGISTTALAAMPAKVSLLCSGISI